MSGVAKFRRRKLTDAEKAAAFWQTHPMQPSTVALRLALLRPRRVWETAARVRVQRCWVVLV